MGNTQMQIRCSYSDVMPIAELKKRFHPKNPNVHTPEQIERLSKVLAYQGARKPATLSRRSDLLTAGHGRILAAERAGWDSYPVDYQEYDSEEQEYADLVADNALSEWASLDLSGINAHVPDLGPDFDLDMLGIKDFVLEPAELIPQADEDEIPEQVDTRSKLGDIWQLGRHRLMCGDSTNADCWDAVKSDKPTIVFTSPPYGLGEGAKLREHYVKGAPKLKSLYQDHTDNPDQWFNLMRDWTAMAIANSACVVCNVQMLATNKRDMIAWISEYASHLVDVAIWDKGHGPPQMQANILTNVFEFLFILSPEPNASRTIPLGKFHGNEGNVVRIGKSHNSEFADVHKATMPVELADWACNVMGKESKHVIDPFGGTGTTLIAAEKSGKSCGIIEMDPKYCDVILTRWEQYTGQVAERVIDGE